MMLEVAMEEKFLLPGMQRKNAEQQDGFKTLIVFEGSWDILFSFSHLALVCLDFPYKCCFLSI